MGEAVTDPVKFLLDCAATIERRGHHKFEREAWDGRVCILGAMAVTAFGKAWEYGSGHGPEPGLRKAYVAVHDHLGLDPDRRKIIDWDNAEERTPQQVVNALRSAAFNLRVQP